MEEDGLIFIILGITLGSEQALIKTILVRKIAMLNLIGWMFIVSGVAKNIYLRMLIWIFCIKRHKPQVKNGTAKLSDFKQRGSQISFDFQNAKSAQVDVPIIGYYGYSAKKSKGQVSRLTMDQRIWSGTSDNQWNRYGTDKLLSNIYSKISKIISLVGLII